ncbi:hypothetical protein JL09_g5635 [Pichia kudriavzevii]|uniref:Uncharacterized protein n=1 Tax=Pichia kudriavzevii TaxID=4909 RepID=A0A099NRL6_PICKU|nr:hypothetical protein JL09_g5635 [Pichia kudriavzevii]
MDTHKYLEKQDLHTLLLVEFFNNRYSSDVFELVPAKASNIKGFSN